MAAALPPAPAPLDSRKCIWGIWPFRTQATEWDMLTSVLASTPDASPATDLNCAYILHYKEPRSLTDLSRARLWLQRAVTGGGAGDEKGIAERLFHAYARRAVTGQYNGAEDVGLWPVRHLTYETVQVLGSEDPWAYTTPVYSDVVDVLNTKVPWTAPTPAGHPLIAPGIDLCLKPMDFVRMLLGGGISPAMAEAEAARHAKFADQGIDARTLDADLQTWLNEKAGSWDWSMQDIYETRYGCHALFYREIHTMQAAVATVLGITGVRNLWAPSGQVVMNHIIEAVLSDPEHYIGLCMTLVTNANQPAVIEEIRQSTPSYIPVELTSRALGVNEGAAAPGAPATS